MAKANYVISDKNKTITVNMAQATEKELEIVQFLAKANGYKVKVSTKKAKETNTIKIDKAFIEKYLANDEKGLKEFYNKMAEKSTKNPEKEKGFIGGRIWFLNTYPLQIDKTAIEMIPNAKNRKSFETKLNTIKAEEQRKEYWKAYIK